MFEQPRVLIGTAHLKSVSPYSQGRFHDTPYLDKEAADDWEKRTWRNRLHVNADGNVFMPGMSFKKSVERAAAFCKVKIKGKGSAEYGKHFKAGVLVMEHLHLPVRAADIPGETYFVPANGMSGGGKRVKRTFPVIQEWQGDLTFLITDATITPDVFEWHLREAGKFIGVGRFRPEMGGFYGRFVVSKMDWSEMDPSEMAQAA